MKGVVRQRIEANPPKTKDRNLQWLYESADADKASLGLAATYPHNRVLDLGCGYGRLALAFVDVSGGYVGCDINEQRLAYAEKLFEGCDNIEFIQLVSQNDRYNPGGKKLFKLPLFSDEQPFTAAAAVSVFTHIPDAVECQAWLYEIARVLKPGGIFLSTWLTQPLPDGTSTAHRAVHSEDVVQSLFRNAKFMPRTITGAGTVDDHRRIVATRLEGNS